MPMPLYPEPCICLAIQAHLCYPNSCAQSVLEKLFFYLFHHGIMFAMNVLSEAHLQLVH